MWSTRKFRVQFRLIHDLSFPKEDSVNSRIAKIHSEVHYELLDDCVSINCEIGPGCLVAKADIKDAFRIIPIHSADLGMSRQGHFTLTDVSQWGAVHLVARSNILHRLWSGSLRLSLVFVTYSG